MSILFYNFFYVVVGNLTYSVRQFDQLIYCFVAEKGPQLFLIYLDISVLIAVAIMALRPDVDGMPAGIKKTP